MIPKDVIRTTDSAPFLNNITESRYCLFTNKAVLITSVLPERPVKQIEIIRNELLIEWRINKWAYVK